jgi:hypothetical protein
VERDAPRDMTIPDYQIAGQLPDNPAARINVVFADSGRAAFAATPAGIRAMAHHHMIEGEVNKHGYLKFVRLLVSVHAAERVQRATEAPMSTGRGITTAHQNRGAKRWTQRLDRAKTGIMGGHRTICFRSGFEEI